MVVLGEDPGIKIWGNIRTHVHLGEIFVVLHFLHRQPDAFLEGDRHVVIASIHGLGYAAVGAIGTNDQIHLQAFRLASGLAAGIVGVGEGVRTLAIGAGFNLGHQTVHQLGAKLGGPFTQVGVENLAAAHTYVFILVFKIDIHLPV